MNTPMIIGRQTFDGLGRQLTVDVGGHTTRFHYVDGQLPPSSNVLADGREVAFTYEKHLNHQLLSVKGQDEASALMTYQADLGQLATATGELGVQSFAYTRSGQALSDEWVIDDKTHTTKWQYSFGGLLQGFEDAHGTQHRRELDTVGRVERTRVGNVETRYTYDRLSRPVRVDVLDVESQRALSTSITYDTLSREHTRTFIVTPGMDSEDSPRTMTQTLGYSALDQVILRKWDDGEQQGEETFEYDVRNRLVHYTANEYAAPEDPYGNRIVEQVFTLNALNGYQAVVNTFADGTQDEATFSYAENDPTKVMAIAHTHESWPSIITLAYDKCGRVVGDSLGRRMTWDTQGRLTGVSQESRTCAYRYDPQGHLVDREIDGALSRSFFSADQFTHERTGEDSLQHIGDGDALFALNRVTDGVRKTVLIGTDAQGSVRLEADSAIRTRSYTAHGADVATPEHVPFGHAGQRREPLTGWYIPGGHRPYDPVLMCFLAPDAESPFGRGGINPYAYCAGDPVNRIDPDGHSWVNYALAGAGLVFGLISLVPTLQAALPLAGALFSASSVLTSAQIAALVAATLDVVSLATGVASLAVEIGNGDKKVASILGGVSLVTGLISSGLNGYLHLARQAGAKQRAADLASGWTSKGARREHNGMIFYEATSKSVDVAIIDSYHGTKQSAFVTHGDPFRAILMGPDGKPVRAGELARDFLSKNLPQSDEPLVLLACWGGKNGSAMEIAQVLKRPVQAFDDKIYVAGYAGLQARRIPANTPQSALPFWASGKGSGLAQKGKQFAPSKLYFPDGRIEPVPFQTF